MDFLRFSWPIQLSIMYLFLLIVHILMDSCNNVAALKDLFSHYVEAWKSWYSEVAGKKPIQISWYFLPMNSQWISTATKYHFFFFVLISDLTKSGSVLYACSLCNNLEWPPTGSSFLPCLYSLTHFFSRFLYALIPNAFSSFLNLMYFNRWLMLSCMH